MLAKAGEGTVYSVVDRPDRVAKVFHADLKGLREKRDKVHAMVRCLPVGAVQADGFVVLAWPTELIDGDRVGFLMPRIDTSAAVEIHQVSNPWSRANPTFGAGEWTAEFTWDHLVHTAANLCLAVDLAHQAGTVIGDFQERNILVSDDGRVSLLDCDSMQFTDAVGRRYLCAPGRAEFTAPELVGVHLRAQPRRASSDLFALAVHIHLLLMAGNHPFLRGTWLGPDPQPDALSLAKFGHWAGGEMSSLHTQPSAPPVSFLPVPIRRLFARAFTEGARDPERRPSAREWRAALLEIETESCAAGHRYPVDCAACPWCAVQDVPSDTPKRRLGAGLGRLTAAAVVFGGLFVGAMTLVLANSKTAEVRLLPADQTVRNAEPDVIYVPPGPVMTSFAPVPPVPPGPVTYSITGSVAPGDSISVTYTDSGGIFRTQHDVRIPWTLTLSPESPNSVGELSASSASGDSQLNCVISGSNGTVLSTNYSNLSSVLC